MLIQDLADRVEFYGRKSVIPRQGQRLKPIFAYPPLALHVDILWFMAVKAYEE